MGAPALAWRQLKRQRLRLVVAVAGVTFAVVLMFMQFGFRTALFDSAVRFHAHLSGDLILLNPSSSYLAQMKGFTWRRLYQASGFAEVESVSSVYTDSALWKNPDTGETHRIFVAGIDPTRPGLDMEGVLQNLDSLRLPDHYVFDEDSRPDYGAIAAPVRSGGSVQAELGDREVTVVGLFKLGTSFGIDGSLVTSDLNFLRAFPTQQEGLIQIGVIRLKPGADPEAVRTRMAAALPRDVEVLTKQGLVQREINYWAAATPIGYVFTFGAIMGFIVGMVIVYQILFADVSDHLAEYATLKAMGYRDAYLFLVVLCQAVMLALFGYLPGIAASRQLYRLTNSATHLPMNLGTHVAGLVFGLTVTMCAISGMIAVRKVRTADPAEIF